MASTTRSILEGLQIGSALGQPIAQGLLQKARNDFEKQQQEEAFNRSIALMAAKDPNFASSLQEIQTVPAEGGRPVSARPLAFTPEQQTAINIGQPIPEVPTIQMGKFAQAPSIYKQGEMSDEARKFENQLKLHTEIEKVKQGFATTQQMNEFKNQKDLLDQKYKQAIEQGDRENAARYKLENDLLDKKIKAAETGKTNLGSARYEQSIRREFNADPIVKNFKEIRIQNERMNNAIKESTQGGSLIAVDQALISTFNKMLDPQSVVRESEYARTPSDQGILNKLKGKAQKLFTGGAGLTNDEREALKRMASKFYDSSKKYYDETVDYYSGIAEDKGLNPELVIRKYNESSEQPSGNAPDIESFKKKHGL